jgi:hypothetical protein
MLNDRIEKKILNTKNYYSQLELTYQTCDLGHETEIST